jgi:hypothetical protein
MRIIHYSGKKDKIPRDSFAEQTLFSGAIQKSGCVRFDLRIDPLRAFFIPAFLLRFDLPDLAPGVVLYFLFRPGDLSFAFAGGECIFGGSFKFIQRDPGKISESYKHFKRSDHNFSRFAISQERILNEPVLL